MLLAWNDSADASSRVFHITVPTWHQMNVAVKDCLPSGCASIHANVKARDAGIILQQVLPDSLQELVRRNEFRLVQTKEVLDMTSRYHQRMAGGNGKSIANGITKIVLGNNFAIWVTENTPGFADFVGICGPLRIGRHS